MSQTPDNEPGWGANPSAPQGGESVELTQEKLEEQLKHGMGNRKDDQLNVYRSSTRAMAWESRGLGYGFRALDKSFHLRETQFLGDQEHLPTGW